MNPPMSSRQIELLLEELCIDLGFCLPPDVQAQLIHEPPADVDEFTDAVIRAEGLDPYTGIPTHLRRDIRQRVTRCFKVREDEHVA